MKRTKKGFVLFRVLALVAVLTAISAADTRAEQLLLVYPNSPAIFRFDPAQYELITPSSPEFNSFYAIGNEMLWDTSEQRIPIEVYRAPILVGFEPSTDGMNAFVTKRNEFHVIIDGFCDYPRYLSNLKLRFFPDPQSTLRAVIDGVLEQHLVCDVGTLVVTTPIEFGYFADTTRRHLRWSGTSGVRIIVFVDKNFNGVYDGGTPKWSIYAEDSTVPVEETSWGSIKARYRD